MDRNRRIMIIAWSLALLWMGVIFYLSSQSGLESAHLSSGFREKLLSFLGLFFPAIKTASFDGFDYFIRKNAHFFAYLFLGILVYFAVTNSHWPKPFFTAMIICVMYAASDEWHQLFVPGRSGQISDVLLDSSGALLGIIVCLFILKIFFKKNTPFVKKAYF